jgi:predicted RNA polymerase sigma factor
VTGPSGIEGLLRELAPRALGAVVRRFGDFAGAEDAVQEALVAAISQWPVDGTPDDPLAWLVRVSSSAADDTLLLLFMCCHPALTPGSAIPLTLRAVAGLTTREIAAAFLVPEATMGQRISRAKARIEASKIGFTLPSSDERVERLQSVLHVLYLLFNEGYVTNDGPELARRDLSEEAIRLARQVHMAVPDDPEVTGLLALMLLNDARRAARTGADGELVPLADQDRSRWDRHAIAEGVALITSALRQGRVGEYQLQAAIAAVHDQATRYEDTNWGEIVALYGLLERMAPNPMVTLNRAVATAMLAGPAAGLVLLEGLDEQLGDHHRLHSVRAHLLEQAGDRDGAVAEFRTAAARATNLRERQFLTIRAARLTTGE